VSTGRFRRIGVKAADPEIGTASGASVTDEVRALVEGANFAHVASTRADGSPDVVPVWITTVGDRLAFFTQRTSSKSRNLERDGRVAISIADQDNPYRAAHIRGRVVERRADAPAIWDEVIDPMSRKYTGADFPFRPETTVLYLVEVESAKLRELPFAHSRGGTQSDSPSQ
jgi:PPOX class probable F420-dependent enzyme